MPEIIQFIAELIERDFAYEADGDVYFDVGKDSQYGKLSNRSVESMQGEGGETVGRKRHVADFALWKSAKPGEPSWDSPWGKGRPGWHIECSAMSRKLLGRNVRHSRRRPRPDVSASRKRNRPERMLPRQADGQLLGAQRPAARGQRQRKDRRPRRTRGSGGVSGEAAPDAVSGKMSRSKGAGGLADLIKRQGGERIRFFLLRTHYRSTVLFNEPAIEEAGIGLESFYRLFKRYTRVTGKDVLCAETGNTRAKPAMRRCAAGERSGAGGGRDVSPEVPDRDG